MPNKDYEILFKNMDRIKKYEQKLIDRLRERVKCEYCKHDMEGKSIEDKYAIETMVDDVFLYNWCKCGVHTIYRIYYCPMCGRKLDEEFNISTELNIPTEFNIPTGLTTPEEHVKYLKFDGEIKIIDPDTGRNLVIDEKGFYWENTEGEEDGGKNYNCI